MIRPVVDRSIRIALFVLALSLSGGGSAVSQEADLFSEQFLKGFMQGFNERSRENEATNRGMGQLAEVQRAIRRHYAHAPSYSGLANDVIIDMLPNDLKVDGRIVNSFGGGIKAISADWGAGKENTFAVMFTEVPWSACTKLLTVDLGVGLAAVMTKSFDKTSALTRSEALAACSEPRNSILWLFF